MSCPKIMPLHLKSWWVLGSFRGNLFKGVAFLVSASSEVGKGGKMNKTMIFLVGLSLFGCSKQSMEASPAEIAISKPEASTAADCMRWGCSNQNCGEPSEVKDMMGTCEWREEYRCHQLMDCKRGADKKCALSANENSKKCLTEIKANSPSN